MWPVDMIITIFFLRLIASKISLPVSVASSNPASDHSYRRVRHKQFLAAIIPQVLLSEIRTDRLIRQVAKFLEKLLANLIHDINSNESQLSQHITKSSSVPFFL